jgi:sulfur carrier protein
MLQVQLNGELLDINHEQTVSEFIDKQDFNGRFVIVINDEMVAKSCWQDVVIQAGDRIDIVSPISGG